MFKYINKQWELRRIGCQSFREMFAIFFSARVFAATETQTDARDRMCLACFCQCRCPIIGSPPSWKNLSSADNLPAKIRHARAGR